MYWSSVCVCVCVCVGGGVVCSVYVCMCVGIQYSVHVYVIVKARKGVLSVVHEIQVRGARG